MLALRAVAYVAQRQDSFISDDVWDALASAYPDVTTHEHRAMGAVMRRAVAEGVCALASCEHCRTTKVMTTGRRAHGNATDMPVYRSLYRARAALPATPKGRER